MSSRSGVSSTARHQQTFGTTTTSPTAATNGMAPASNGGGFVLQDHPDDKVLVAQACPPPLALAKEYFNASFGVFTEGHYTEF
jgi:hypothetical protein